MIAGSLATATGLLLTGLTISSVLSFYDNSKNSQSLSDKLYTALELNNLIVSMTGAWGLNTGLEFTTLGATPTTEALRGLIRNNCSLSSQTTEKTPLLASDIETINNCNTKANNRNNPVMRIINI